jgi:ElaB/YqjD/DUF883 family membrane-anchored ribosome-binding protein
MPFHDSLGTTFPAFPTEEHNMQTTNQNTPFPTSGSGSNGSEGLNRAATSAHSAVDRVAERTAGSAENMATKVKPVIDRVASSAHQYVDKAVGVAVPTAEWLSERSQDLKDTQDRMIEDARQYVSANPLKAVAAALVAGLLIGRIVR